MKSNVLIIVIISLLAAVGVGYSIYSNSYRQQPVEQEVTENPVWVEEGPSYDERPDLYYQSLLYKSDKGFKEIGLYTILGPDYEKFNYVVDADPKIQEYMDKTLKGYCHQTLNLFNMAWKDMKENNLYDGHMINVLESIIRQQKEFLNKYGSSEVKEYAKTNIFQEENIALAAAYSSSAEQQMESRNRKKDEMLDLLITEYEFKNTK